MAGPQGKTSDEPSGWYIVFLVVFVIAVVMSFFDNDNDSSPGLTRAQRECVEEIVATQEVLHVLLSQGSSSFNERESRRYAEGECR